MEALEILGYLGMLGFMLLLIIRTAMECKSQLKLRKEDSTLKKK